MKSIIASASICLTALLAITAPVHAQSKAELSIDFHTSSGISISIPYQQYRDLINAKVSKIDSQQYVIRRRLGTRPVAYKADRTKLFNLYLDVYNQQGERLDTGIHNQPKPAGLRNNRGG